MSRIDRISENWDFVSNGDFLCQWGWRDYGMGPGMMWGGWGIGWIFMIVFWGLIALGLILLVRWLIGMTKGAKIEETALDILKKRYARGEIGREEFEEKKKDLL